MVVLALLLAFAVVLAEELPKYNQDNPEKIEQVIKEQGPPKVEEEVKKYEDIKPSELRKLVIEKDTKDIIRFMQERLVYGGEKELSLSGSNFFYYHPNLPVVFVFDDPVEDVLVYSGGAKAIYKRNVLVVFPPPSETGKLFGFVVFLADGKAYSFAGERVNPLKDKKAVITYYSYYKKEVVPVERVLEAFLDMRRRCPANGEAVVIGGVKYVFEKQDKEFTNAKDEIFACGSVFRVRADY